MANFNWVDGLSGQECEEFNQWVFSQNGQIQYILTLEFQKLMMAGLTIDTASYLYEDYYETHLVPLDEANVYFLFVRAITNKDIVSLGQCPMERGTTYAVKLLYERTCKFYGKTSMWGYPRIK
jgi:hypothetical protein